MATQEEKLRKTTTNNNFKNMIFPLFVFSDTGQSSFSDRFLQENKQRFFSSDWSCETSESYLTKKWGHIF